jgi:hypothetical protein
MNWTDSSQKKKYNWLIRTWRNVQHHCQKGNANQNYTDISFHSSQDGDHQENKSLLARMWGKRNSIHCWWECDLVQPLCKPVCKFFKKLKMEYIIWSCYTAPGMYLRECKPAYSKDACIPMFTAALLKVAKQWNQLPDK